MTISDDIVVQVEQCLRNIAAALEQAGSSLRDVVRVVYVLPDASLFPQCWPTLRKVLWRGSPGGDDDLGGAGGSADEDRNRGDRAQASGEVIWRRYEDDRIIVNMSVTFSRTCSGSGET